uniref:Uncharacterized protein n=1 Tax=Xiphophorus couchianus TaxID=32473 RepID=A0A3B5LDF6_9TELE
QGSLSSSDTNFKAFFKWKEAGAENCALESFLFSFALVSSLSLLPDRRSRKSLEPGIFHDYPKYHYLFKACAFTRIFLRGFASPKRTNVTSASLLHNATFLLGVGTLHAPRRLLLLKPQDELSLILRSGGAVSTLVVRPQHTAHVTV